MADRPPFGFVERSSREAKVPQPVGDADFDFSGL
jgi:hypothetical protein